MNLTTEQLQQIIQEELQNVIDEKSRKKRKKARKRRKAKKKGKKKDACYHKVKSRYKVWPSAYASGALVKCRKVGAKNWGNKSESLDEAEITDDEEEELKDVSDQLKGAVKAHGKQAKAIDRALKKEGKKNCGCGQDPCKTYGIQEQVLNEEDEYINEEEMSDKDREELEKIRDKLYGASKAHKGQADDIDGILKEDEIEEAVYRGKTVKLNKPMRGDVKKFKVYVNSGKKDAKGRIKAKKVNFGHGGSSAKKKGEKTMRIRKSNPKARKNFRARHNCDNPGPKTKARYWSCKKW